MKGKLIVKSGPSGTGKTSIVKYLIKQKPCLTFSVSACSRSKRFKEQEGRDYYFLTVKDFKKKIEQDEFLEWEEVYENQYYGTLKKEINRIWDLKQHVIFDIDVFGALSIKKKFPKNTLTIFIMPPSINVLKSRLSLRGTETKKSTAYRIEKAKQEIYQSNKFDFVVLNNNLKEACAESLVKINEFIQK